MKRILMIRHGETEWNKARKIMGWADIPLNETGREQAGRIGIILKKLYEIEAIYSSDLSRAVETAEIIRSSSCPTAEIMETRAFREMNPGAFSGYRYYELPPEADLMTMNYERAMDFRREGGETLREFNDRVLNAFHGLLEELPAVSLIVTHSGVISTVLGKMKGLNPLECLIQIHPFNCAIQEIRFEPANRKTYIEKENYLIDRIDTGTTKRLHPYRST